MAKHSPGGRNVVIAAKAFRQAEADRRRKKRERQVQAQQSKKT